MDRFEHRKSSVKITLRDAAGLPVAGQKVRLSLKKHEFLFGTGTFFLVRRQADNVLTLSKESPALTVTL